MTPYPLFELVCLSLAFAGIAFRGWSKGYHDATGVWLIPTWIPTVWSLIWLWPVVDLMLKGARP